MCVCVLLCGLVVGYFCGSFSSPSIPTPQLYLLSLYYLSRVSSGQRVRDRNFVAGLSVLCVSRGARVRGFAIRGLLLAVAVLREGKRGQRKWVGVGWCWC